MAGQEGGVAGNSGGTDGASLPGGGPAALGGGDTGLGRRRKARAPKHQCHRWVQFVTGSSSGASTAEPLRQHQRMPFRSTRSFSATADRKTVIPSGLALVFPEPCDQLGETIWFIFFKAFFIHIDEVVFCG